MIYHNISNKWEIIFFTSKKEIPLMNKYLKKINCSNKDIDKAQKILFGVNQGFTFTNYKLKCSIVGISQATSKSEWFNTVVHELKHVQSHICEFYNISEDGEDAAYLIGHLMKIFIKNI